jgi:hypothetical protein
MSLSHPFSARPVYSGATAGHFGFGAGVPVSPELASTAAGRVRNLDAAGQEDGTIWSTFRNLYVEPLRQLATADRVEQNAVVDTLFASPLTHGFSQGHVVSASLAASEGARFHVGAIVLDRLYRLAEAVGALRVQSLEHGQAEIHVGDVDEVFASVEEILGVELPPTKQAGGLFGLKIRAGIYSDRHFDGIYGAWRARQLAAQNGISEPTLLEIGGGAGFLTFYARQFGFKRIAIIDLPVTSLVQYVVLASELGPDSVTFDKVPENGVGLLNALSSTALNTAGFDIVVNVDSLPEMPPDAAAEYLNSIQSGQLLLSINQESGMSNGPHAQVVVAEAAKTAGLRRLSRYPAWLRTGYVEEVYIRPQPTRAAPRRRGPPRRLAGS